MPIFNKDSANQAQHISLLLYMSTFDFNSSSG